MLLLRSIFYFTLWLTALPVFAVDAKTSGPIPETDIGRIVVDISSTEPDRNWVAKAHELNVINMFKDSPRIQNISKATLDFGSCSDFSCRRRLLKGAKVDLYIEGTLLADSLQYRALVPETEQVLSAGSISIAPHTLPEQVKSAFLHAMKPFTESGGILDQRVALRRAEKAAAERGTKLARQTMGIALGVLAIIVLGIVITSILIFPHGRRPLLVIAGLWIFFALGPLWLISEDLALVKPVAIFAIPEPWVLAVIGGLGAGWALWGFGLCILPQLRGLETLKQERMPQVVDALAVVTLYRSVVALLWISLAIGMVLGAREIFGLDKVHTVALGLMIFGGFATLSALVFEIIAQHLDRRFIIGSPHVANPWHQRIIEALADHPILAPLEDLASRALFLPTQLDHPLTYGGGLSRPRLLLPEAALQKAFATRPEDNAIAYDFLVGLVLDGLAKISLRTHLESTLRLGKGLKSATVPPSGTGFLLAPYRRSRGILEGCFLTVHEGIGHFIQYLYWRHNPESQLLTVSANSRQLHIITRRIVDQIQGGPLPTAITTPRDHINWLAQNFLHHPDTGASLSARSRFRVQPRVAIIFTLLFILIGYQIIAAILYHPVYEERIAAQQARIEEKKKKKEGQAHAEETKTSDASSIQVGDATVPDGGRTGIPPTVAPAKSKKVVAKTAAPKPRKGKGKARKQGSRKKGRHQR